MKKIILLGASGSIGVQTIDVLKNHTQYFDLVAFSVGHNVAYARELLAIFNVESVYVRDKDDALALQRDFPKVKFYYEDDLEEFVYDTDADLVVNALIGFVGLKPTVAAIKTQKDVAIANKETLVAGGQLIKDLAKEYEVALIPVDSEHSAILQCLQGNKREDLESITITASGGSFRDYQRDELLNVTKEDALNHPNWSMGEKITIDSATMMNKGLEVIEAHYLFDIDYDQIHVLQHNESIVHSFITFQDSSSLAQMGASDMRVAIQYALTYPRHLKMKNPQTLDLAELGKLTFKAMDYQRFPLLKLAFEVGREAGNKPIIMNSANEVAVDLFLKDKISFLDIETLVIKTTKSSPYEEVENIDQIIEIDQKTRVWLKENYQAIIEGDI